MFQTKVVQKLETHTFYVQQLFFRKSCRLLENVEKCCTAEQATDGNMAHAHCMLNNEGYKYTHTSCVMLIAFPLQQWLHERATMLRYTYIACLVISTKAR